MNDNANLALGNGKVELSATATVTDGDNDSVSTPLSVDLGGSISFDDDLPSASSNLAVQLDDDALAGGIPGGVGDDADSLNASGTLAHDFGADGAGAVQWLTTGAPAGFTYEAGPGGSLLVKQGGTTVLTLTLNSATGEYGIIQNAPIQHDLGDDENNEPFTFTYQVTDYDGDSTTGTLSVDVDDDTPMAKDDHAVAVAGQPLDVNAVFVLDFSGSISDSELNDMLEAVRAAAQALFNGASDVNVQIVAFSGTALSYPVYSDFASFSALIDSINPDDGGTRPFNGNTDFTAAIEVTMDDYTPLPGWSNQVFFISDGNPNEQLGTGGNSLEDDTASDWLDFINDYDLNVTTIGVGGGIDEDRLQDVDLDGSGSPILVGDFDDLIDTLLDAVTPDPVEGSVLLGSDGVVSGDDDAFGADGPGRIASIEINGTPYTWDGVLDGDEQLTDIPTEWGGTLSFNFATGEWSYQPPATIDGDKVETFDYVIVDSDGDPSPATLTIHVEDPAPVIGKVDEDELPGGITDDDSETTVVSGSLVELLVGINSADFALSGSAVGLPTLTSDGVSVTYSFSGSTLTAMAGLLPVFTLEVAANGDYIFTLLGPLDHPDDNGDDNETLVLDLTAALEASVGGNSVPLAGSLLIQVEDDVPAILSTSNLVYSNSSNPGGATGVFDYSTGADTRGSGPFSSSDSDFASITLSGTVGGAAISSQSVTWISESATTATFEFEFEYAPNPLQPGTTEQATGTLTFNKADGTYTVSLDGPVEGFSVLKTSSSLGITGYEPGTNVEDNTQPAVAVSQLATDFFVQFQSYAEPGGGTDGNNLQTGGADTNIWVPGELFTQAASYVTVTNSSNGVSGDTIQKGEVLDFDFYTSNPFGNTGLTPTGRADGIFLKFDGIGASDDLVVVLKLIGAGGVTTTRSLVISSSDIYKSSSGATALAALAAYGITLDNNDGAIVIESNDFNGAGESWQIYGAQLLTSVEGITTSSAINFDSGFGDSGASNTVNTGGFGFFATDNDVIKVSDIGFIGTTTTTLDAELDFQVAVQDSDDDTTSTANLHVTIEAGTTFTGTAMDDVIQGGTGNDTLSGLAGDDVLIGGLGDDMLIGGAGHDTYMWKAGDTGTDTVQDFVHNFNGNADGDRLDLSELLSGENQTGGIGNLLNFIDISTANLGGGGALDTVIKVSDTATVNPESSAEQTIVLQDVNLYSVYGGDEANVILSMLNDGTLKTDVA
ncbi:MAG: type I secretion C-terminal target domain-containing protein [Pseudomonadaceae bacterium]|nr:type I secretion C-terminal target domain-containing protein [Pseudomonadaceae bacterium]